jgi:hypothetical protein
MCQQATAGAYYATWTRALPRRTPIATRALRRHLTQAGLQPRGPALQVGAALVGAPRRARARLPHAQLRQQAARAAPAAETGRAAWRARHRWSPARESLLSSTSDNPSVAIPLDTGRDIECASSLTQVFCSKPCDTERCQAVRLLQIGLHAAPRVIRGRSRALRSVRARGLGRLALLGRGQLGR